MNVNPNIHSLSDKTTEVVIKQVCNEAEIDEQWSYVGNKSNQRWLWYAICHVTGVVLAYVFGRRKHKVCKQLTTLLAPFEIKRFYTDNWDAYGCYLEKDKHQIGKDNTQKIERKNLTFRTRIKRLAHKTICFSKCQEMHDTTIGLLINKTQ